MRHARGFTLIELAIVLVIITVLIGGLALPVTAQIQARKIAETKKILEEAREAIIGYAMSHTTGECACVYTKDGLTSNSTCTSAICPKKPLFDPENSDAEITLTLKPRPYLPCPADDSGREKRVGNVCAMAEGWFPWTDLGTAVHDAWGNRLRYSVENREYADSSKGLPSNPSTRNPPFDGLNLKRICATSDCDTSPVADHLPVVLLSHGPNGRGALNINGGTLAAPDGDDEKQNLNGDVTFVSRPPYQPTDGSEEEKSKEFDDLVVWISDGLLRARVCPAGGCP